MAISHYHPKVANFLIDKGANKILKNNAGKTAINLLDECLRDQNDFNKRKCQQIQKLL
jgi:hypothetical protein